MRRVHVLGHKSTGKSTFIAELARQLRHWGVHVGTPSAPLGTDCDLLLVEGDPAVLALKIEVWRPESGAQPMAASRGDITAVVSDDPIDPKVPWLPRWDMPFVADAILALVDLPPSRRAMRPPS